MRIRRSVSVMCGLVGVFVILAFGQWVGGAHSRPQTGVDDPVKVLVRRLDLERYKSTIKGLTQFGDRLQGTDRNKAAVDWIEAQLRSYGCTPAAPAVRLCATARSTASGASPSPDCQRRSDQRSWRFEASRGHLAGFRSWPCRHRSRCPGGSCVAGVECAAGTAARSARGGLLHQGRHDAPR